MTQSGGTGLIVVIQCGGVADAVMQDEGAVMGAIQDRRIVPDVTQRGGTGLIVAV